VSAAIEATYPMVYWLVKGRQSTNLGKGITAVSIERMHTELIKVNKKNSKSANMVHSPAGNHLAPNSGQDLHFLGLFCTNLAIASST
jgi:hypothetical protein